MDEVELEMVEELLDKDEVEVDEEDDEIELELFVLLQDANPKESIPEASNIVQIETLNLFFIDSPLY